eukprot:1006173_1
MSKRENDALNEEEEDANGNDPRIGNDSDDDVIVGIDFTPGNDEERNHNPRFTPSTPVRPTAHDDPTPNSNPSSTSRNIPTTTTTFQIREEIRAPDGSVRSDYHAADQFTLRDYVIAHLGLRTIRVGHETFTINRKSGKWFLCQIIARYHNLTNPCAKSASIKNRTLKKMKNSKHDPSRGIKMYKELNRAFWYQPQPIPLPNDDDENAPIIPSSTNRWQSPELLRKLNSALSTSSSNNRTNNASSVNNRAGNASSANNRNRDANSSSMRNPNKHKRTYAGHVSPISAGNSIRGGCIQRLPPRRPPLGNHHRRGISQHGNSSSRGNRRGTSNRSNTTGTNNSSRGISGTRGSITHCNTRSTRGGITQGNTRGGNTQRSTRGGITQGSTRGGITQGSTRGGIAQGSTRGGITQDHPISNTRSGNTNSSSNAPSNTNTNSSSNAPSNARSTTQPRIPPLAQSPARSQRSSLHNANSPALHNRNIASSPITANPNTQHAARTRQPLPMHDAHHQTSSNRNTDVVSASLNTLEDAQLQSLIDAQKERFETKVDELHPEFTYDDPDDIRDSLLIEPGAYGPDEAFMRLMRTVEVQLSKRTFKLFYPPRLALQQWYDNGRSSWFLPPNLIYLLSKENGGDTRQIEIPYLDMHTFTVKSTIMDLKAVDGAKYGGNKFLNQKNCKKCRVACTFVITHDIAKSMKNHPDSGAAVMTAIAAAEVHGQYPYTWRTSKVLHVLNVMRAGKSQEALGVFDGNYCHLRALPPYPKHLRAVYRHVRDKYGLRKQYHSAHQEFSLHKMWSGVQPDGAAQQNQRLNESEHQTAAPSNIEATTTNTVNNTRVTNTVSAPPPSSTAATTTSTVNNTRVSTQQPSAPTIHNPQPAPASTPSFSAPNISTISNPDILDPNAVIFAPGFGTNGSVRSGSAGFGISPSPSTGMYNTRHPQTQIPVPCVALPDLNYTSVPSANNNYNFNMNAFGATAPLTPQHQQQQQQQQQLLPIPPNLLPQLIAQPLTPHAQRPMHTSSQSPQLPVPRVIPQCYLNNNNNRPNPRPGLSPGYVTQPLRQHPLPTIGHTNFSPNNANNTPHNQALTAIWNEEIAQLKLSLQAANERMESLQESNDKLWEEKNTHINLQNLNISQTEDDTKKEEAPSCATACTAPLSPADAASTTNTTTMPPATPAVAIPTQDTTNSNGMDVDTDSPPKEHQMISAFTKMIGDSMKQMVDSQTKAISEMVKHLGSPRRPDFESDDDAKKPHSPLRRHSPPAPITRNTTNPRGSAKRLRYTKPQLDNDEDLSPGTQSALADTYDPTDDAALCAEKKDIVLDERNRRNNKFHYHQKRRKKRRAVDDSNASDSHAYYHHHPERHHQINMDTDPDGYYPSASGTEERYCSHQRNRSHGRGRPRMKRPRARRHMCQHCGHMVRHSPTECKKNPDSDRYDPHFVAPPRVSHRNDLASARRSNSDDRRRGGFWRRSKNHRDYDDDGYHHHHHRVIESNIGNEGYNGDRRDNPTNCGRGNRPSSDNTGSGRGNQPSSNNNIGCGRGNRPSRNHRSDSDSSNSFISDGDIIEAGRALLLLKQFAISACCLLYMTGILCLLRFSPPLAFQYIAHSTDITNLNQDIRQQYTQHNRTVATRANGYLSFNEVARVRNALNHPNRVLTCYEVTHPLPKSDKFISRTARKLLQTEPTFHRLIPKPFIHIQDTDATDTDDTQPILTNATTAMVSLNVRSLKGATVRTKKIPQIRELLNNLPAVHLVHLTETLLSKQEAKATCKSSGTNQFGKFKLFAHIPAIIKHAGVAAGQLLLIHKDFFHRFVLCQTTECFIHLKDRATSIDYIFGYLFNPETIYVSRIADEVKLLQNILTHTSRGAVIMGDLNLVDHAHTTNLNAHLLNAVTEEFELFDCNTDRIATFHNYTFESANDFQFGRNAPDQCRIQQHLFSDFEFKVLLEGASISDHYPIYFSGSATANTDNLCSGVQQHIAHHHSRFWSEWLKPVDTIANHFDRMYLYEDGIELNNIYHQFGVNAYYETYDFITKDILLRRNYIRINHSKENQKSHSVNEIGELQQSALTTITNSELSNRERAIAVKTITKAVHTTIEDWKLAKYEHQFEKIRIAIEDGTSDWWKLIRIYDNPLIGVQWPVVEPQPHEKKEPPVKPITYYDTDTKAFVINNQFRKQYQDIHAILSPAQLSTYEATARALQSSDYRVEHRTWSHTEIATLVRAYLKKQKTDKSTGLSILSWSIIKALNINMISDQVHKIINAGVIPDREQDSQLIIIPKKSKKFRGIRIVGLIRNILEFICNHYAIEGTEMNPYQYGDKGTALNIIALRMLIENSVIACKPVYLAICDLDKAFDRCHASVSYVQFKQQHPLVDPRIYPIKMSMEQHNYLVPVIDGVSTTKFQQLVGKSQGGRMSPLDYGVHTNEVVIAGANHHLKGITTPVEWDAEHFRCLNASTTSYDIDLNILVLHIFLLLYVDDMILVADSLDQLQTIISFISDGLQTIGARFKPAKSKWILLNEAAAREDEDLPLRLDHDTLEKLDELQTINYLGYRFKFLESNRSLDMNIQLLKNVSSTYSRLISIPQALARYPHLLIKRALLLACINIYGADISLMTADTACRSNAAIAFGIRKLYGCHITTHRFILFTLFGIKRMQMRNAIMMFKTFKKVQSDLLLTSLALHQKKIIDASRIGHAFTVTRRKMGNTLGFRMKFHRTFYMTEIRKVFEIYNLKDHFTVKQATAAIEDFHCRREIMNVLIEPRNWLGYLFELRLVQHCLMRTRATFIKAVNEYAQNLSVEDATELLRFITGNHIYYWDMDTKTKENEQPMYSCCKCGTSIQVKFLNQHLLCCYAITPVFQLVSRNTFKNRVLARLKGIHQLLTQMAIHN